MENKQDLPENESTAVESEGKQQLDTQPSTEERKQAAVEDKADRAIDAVAEQLAVAESTETKTKAKKAKSSSSGSKKKKQKYISDGVVHVHATFNNTIITITDHQGNTLSWGTAGTDFKGSRKSTPFAAQVAATQAIERALAIASTLKNVDVVVKGPGPGREACIRVIADAGLTVKSIRDITPIPHNGCRPPKRRRV
jgi:small subunit ribosomal protein S11